MISQSLAHLSTLRQNVYTARQSYWLADFGNPYKEYEALKSARKAYSDACCKYVEETLDHECKGCENSCNKSETELEGV